MRLTAGIVGPYDHGVTGSPRYDTIGRQYSSTRREDPRLRERIHAALGDSRTVVNVGAGTGSYEPLDRHVIAIEPSDVMAGQRPLELAPALRGTAAPLPLRDSSVDAAMAVLTVHHWDDQQEHPSGNWRPAHGTSATARFVPWPSTTSACA